MLEVSFGGGGWANKIVFVGGFERETDGRTDRKREPGEKGQVFRPAEIMLKRNPRGGGRW